MPDVIEDSFLFLPILKFFSLYQPEKITTFNKIKAYSFWGIFTTTSTLLGCLKWFTTPEEMNMNYTRNYIVACGCYIPKLLIFIVQQERIVKCVRYFAQPYFAADGKMQKKIIKNCVRQCNYFSFAYLAAITMGVSSATIPKLFAQGLKLPLSFWLPYDHTSNIFVFYVTYVMFVLCIFYNAFNGCLIDMLLGGLAYHAACQFQVLNYNLHNFKVKDARYIEKCVLRYTRILSFIYEYQDCFSTIIVCQFAGSLGTTAIFIADLVFVPMESTSSLSVPVLGSYIILFQLFFYCYFGQLILEEQNRLTDSIYSSSWYRYKLQTQKELVLTMERTQMPMFITVGKCIDLNLLMFIKMLRTIYSIVALLHKFQT